MTHEMELVKEHETGAKEFLCPVCGRRGIVDWDNVAEPIKVLEEGDWSACHSGGTGGLEVSSVGVMDRITKFWSDAISKLKGEL